MTLINLSKREFDAVMTVASMLDAMGYAKRGSSGEAFTSLANRLDETNVMQRADPERCKVCKGSGWVER